MSRQRALSRYARGKKLEHFLSRIPKDARILEVGCAGGWVGKYAVERGWKNFTGIDPVDSGAKFQFKFVHGDVNDWRELGLHESSFDAIIAFEVVEHGDFFTALRDLMKPGGTLMVTTPVPHMDWACKVLETLRLNQTRTSPHTHLVYLQDVPGFRLADLQIKAGLSQWGIMEKA